MSRAYILEEDGEKTSLGAFGLFLNRDHVQLGMADWFALLLLLLGGTLLGIDSWFDIDVFKDLATNVPTVGAGMKGLIGIASFYWTVRLLLIKSAEASR